MTSKMKTDLEKSDIVAIAKEVAELVKPLLRTKTETDTIFDVKGLANYLKVDASWIYNQAHLKTIPYFKIGKYIRFRKSDIEKWISGESIKPIPS
jgi:excisionase family DNA binding protein